MIMTPLTIIITIALFLHFIVYHRRILRITFFIHIVNQSGWSELIMLASVFLTSSSQGNCSWRWELPSYYSSYASSAWRCSWRYLLSRWRCTSNWKCCFAAAAVSISNRTERRRRAQQTQTRRPRRKRTPGAAGMEFRHLFKSKWELVLMQCQTCSSLKTIQPRRTPQNEDEPLPKPVNRLQPTEPTDRQRSRCCNKLKNIIAIIVTVSKARTKNENRLLFFCSLSHHFLSLNALKSPSKTKLLVQFSRFHKK